MFFTVSAIVCGRVAVAFVNEIGLTGVIVSTGARTVPVSAACAVSVAVSVTVTVALSIAPAASEPDAWNWTQKEHDTRGGEGEPCIARGCRGQREIRRWANVFVMVGVLGVGVLPGIRNRELNALCFACGRREGAGCRADSNFWSEPHPL